MSFSLNAGVLPCADKVQLLLSVDHCNGTGHMCGSLEDRSLGLPAAHTRFTMINEPSAFSNHFGLRFNHKSDNNSAAESQRWNEFCLSSAARPWGTHDSSTYAKLRRIKAPSLGFFLFSCIAVDTERHCVEKWAAVLKCNGQTIFML